MRDYGRIYSSFWTSDNAQRLSDDGRLLALYLLSCQHGTIAGVCRLPDGYVCEDLKWSSERVQKGFAELLSNGFANRCETTKWVWVCKHFEWNTPENPNQWKAARKISTQIPENCSWGADFVEEFNKVCGTSVEPLPNRFGTLSKPVSVSETVTVTETESVVVPPELPVEPKRSTSASPEVETVFRHWQQVHKHPQAKLDRNRQKVIASALKSYDAATLCRAITGYRNSPHHMGHNDRKTVYDDIGLFLRDAKHIDAGLKFYDKDQTHGSGVDWSEATSDGGPPQWM